MRLWAGSVSSSAMFLLSSYKGKRSSLRKGKHLFLCLRGYSRRLVEILNGPEADENGKIRLEVMSGQTKILIFKVNKMNQK